jgi:dihydrofolate reductase
MVWETDPSIRENEPGAAVRRCVAAALDATTRTSRFGGAGLAAQAFELGLVDELRMFRYPVVVGGGTPFLAPVTEEVRLDLVETRTFGSRVIYERYRRVRDDPD